MLRTLPSSDAVASVAASVPASAAGAASVAGVDAVLSVVVVSAVSDDPHPAAMDATMDAHKSALMIFFFIENPPP